MGETETKQKFRKPNKAIFPEKWNSQIRIPTEKETSRLQIKGYSKVTLGVKNHSIYDKFNERVKS